MRKVVPALASLLLSALLLGLLVLAGYATNHGWLSTVGRTETSVLPTGRCVVLEGRPDATPAPDGTRDAEVHQVDCADDNRFSYLVGTSGRGGITCPSADYLEYYELQPDRGTQTAQREHTACLIPNFRAGLCYGDDPRSGGYIKVPCSSGATLRIDSVHEVADRGLCGQQQALVFPEPARTFCLRSGE